ncbi:hypothetical protein [Deinococcus carri]|uniref:hypothetical protein n=1 Tax=Deinococcus carri TaxID=1211323 RepID=UPI0031EA4969
MTSFPQTITVIRHGEKPTGAKDSANGVNERGEARSDSLTPRGWQRAGALTALLGAEQVRAPFTRPTVLYTCGYHGDPEGQHHRPRETITPLSRKLGLDIHAPLLKTEGAALATARRRSGRAGLLGTPQHPADGGGPGGGAGRERNPRRRKAVARRRLLLRADLLAGRRRG